jgi:LPPG:FO 2-phospho-L-lactate transferase
VCGQEALTVVVNTGDDLEMWGLHVSPDLDIVTYTLAGEVDESKGWGLRGDTFFCLEQMGRLGRECWFQLGDRDLATHLVRSEMLRRGWTLSQVTRELCSAFGVTAGILPMSDDPVATRVGTRERGEVHFEEYLVKYGAAPTVEYVRYAGAEAARPAPGVLDAIRSAECVVVAPSNPVVSIGAILAIPGIRAALRETPAPVVGVSPLIRGRTVKGPADRMMAQLGYEVSACGVASLYADFLDGFVIDERDAGLEESVAKIGLTVHVTDTLMDSVRAASRLGGEVLDLARRCGRG